MKIIIFALIIIGTLIMAGNSIINNDVIDSLNNRTSDMNIMIEKLN